MGLLNPTHLGISYCKERNRNKQHAEKGKQNAKQIKKVIPVYWLTSKYITQMANLFSQIKICIVKNMPHLMV